MLSNPELEKRLISTLVLDSKAIYSCAGLKPEVFYNSSCLKLYKAIKCVEGRGETVSIVSVSSQDISVAVSLVEITNEYPITPDIAGTIKELKNLHKLRLVVETSHKAINIAKSTAPAVERLSQVKQIEREEAIDSEKRFSKAGSILSEVISDIESHAKNAGKLSGITTGFPVLDNMMLGLQKTDLTILAARPSMGKTALALNIAENACNIGMVNTAFFSLEMSKQQLITRLICNIGQVDSRNIRSGELTQKDWGKITKAGSIIDNMGLFINDDTNLNINDLRLEANKLKMQYDISLIVIDYLQLLSGIGTNKSRQQEISDITRGLKCLAKDIDIPIIALSQLNRALESRVDKRPILSDLRDSGAVEQDADNILFIYRDTVYNPDSENKKAEICIAKQRNGETGTVFLEFEGKYTKFS